MLPTWDLWKYGAFKGTSPIGMFLTIGDFFHKGCCCSCSARTGLLPVFVAILQTHLSHLVAHAAAVSSSSFPEFLLKNSRGSRRSILTD